MILAVILSALSILFFSAGIVLSVVVPQLAPLPLGLSLTLVGLLGLLLSAFLCFWPVLHRQSFWKKAIFSRYSAQPSEADDLNLNPDNAEVVMKSIRGIPYLIQAIQYSMEASYWKDQQGEVVRTSVIHTAPGCTSVLDCDSDNGEAVSLSAPRHSGPDENWESTGESTWRNQQLRLSINRNDTSLLISGSPVFPYREVNTQVESCDHESVLDVEAGPHLEDAHPRRSFETGPTNGGFEIRCIGMSDAFLHKFNSSFKR
uniref:Inner membrane protein n=1 Tax=Steinernema glaseri TaxID=37863 RepID=A0A1I8ACR7_9BILA